MRVTLRFTRDNSLISRVIRFFTWSDFSHVDYVFNDGSCLSAHPHGVDWSSFKNFEYEYFEAQVKDKNKLEKFLLDQIGKPYDWPAIFGIPIRRNWQQSDKWFCSELIASAFEHGGTPLFNERASRITPRDLYINPMLKKIIEQ